MKVNFEEKFEEVLREESKGFDINWSLVEIKTFVNISCVTAGITATKNPWQCGTNITYAITV